MDGDAAKPADNSVREPDKVTPPQAHGVPASSAPQHTGAPQAEAPANTSPQLSSPAADSLAEQQTSTVADDMPGSISWTASEFVAHQKTAGWYALFVLAAVIAAGIVWLFARDPVPTAAVFISMVLLAYYASRQPRQQQYQLDETGLTIGDRRLPYHEFRSFSIVSEGAFLSIELTPLKRFAMYTTVYLDPKDEDQIISALSSHLPVEEARPSLTDSLMRRIHF